MTGRRKSCRRAEAAAREAAEAEAAASKWECPMCTLVNEQSSQVCAACHNNRPSDWHERLGEVLWPGAEVKVSNGQLVECKDEKGQLLRGRAFQFHPRNSDRVVDKKKIEKRYYDFYDVFYEDEHGDIRPWEVKVSHVTPVEPPDVLKDWSEYVQLPGEEGSNEDGSESDSDQDRPVVRRSSSKRRSFRLDDTQSDAASKSQGEDSGVHAEDVRVESQDAPSQKKQVKRNKKNNTFTSQSTHQSSQQPLSFVDDEASSSQCSADCEGKSDNVDDDDDDDDDDEKGMSKSSTASVHGAEEIRNQANPDSDNSEKLSFGNDEFVSFTNNAGRAQHQKQLFSAESKADSSDDNQDARRRQSQCTACDVSLGIGTSQGTKSGTVTFSQNTQGSSSARSQGKESASSVSALTDNQALSQAMSEQSDGDDEQSGGDDDFELICINETQNSSSQYSRDDPNTDQLTHNNFIDDESDEHIEYD